MGRGAWLVEKPDGPRHGQHPGKRETAPLSRREVTRRKSGEVGQADRLKPSLDQDGLVNGAGAIEKSCPERKIFRYRQRRLEGIDVPDIMGLLAAAQFGATAIKGTASCAPPNQACRQDHQGTPS